MYDDIVDQVLAIQSPTELDEFVAITPEEFVREQDSDPLYRAIRAKIDNGEHIPFSMDAKHYEGYLCRTSSKKI